MACHVFCLGGKGPFEPTNQVLVAIFSHHSPGPDYTRQFNLAWSALEMKSLKHEFPRKRWSHSATLLEAKGDYETMPITITMKWFKQYVLWWEKQ